MSGIIITGRWAVSVNGGHDDDAVREQVVARMQAALDEWYAENSDVLACQGDVS